MCWFRFFVESVRYFDGSMRLCVWSAQVLQYAWQVTRSIQNLRNHFRGLHQCFKQHHSWRFNFIFHLYLRFFHYSVNSSILHTVHLRLPFEERVSFLLREKTSSDTIERMRSRRTSSMNGRKVFDSVDLVLVYRKKLWISEVNYKNTMSNLFESNYG